MALSLKISLAERRSSHPRSSSEAGAVVIILVAAVVAVLLSSAVYVASIGYGEVILAELQNAADAAALSAATRLQASDFDWEASRNRAIATLNRQLIRGNLDESRTVAINSTDATTEWFIGTLSISVERGRWIDGKDFQSLENWELNTPGRPGFMAFNAVKVSLSRSGIDSLLSPIISAAMDLKASAVGVIGRVAPTCVPPLAISVCSLIEPDGTSDFYDIQTQQFFFTEADRYCPEDQPACARVPSFAYDSGWTGSNYQTLYTSGTDRYTMYVRAVCGWDAPVQGSNPQDPFGVFGIPYMHGTTASPTNEVEVQQQIASFDPIHDNCNQKFTVGDLFAVHEPGLTDPSSEDIVWDRIRENRVVDSPNYSHFPLMPTPVFQYNAFIPFTNNTEYHFWGAPVSDAFSPVPQRCTRPGSDYYPDLPGLGLCRSRRMQIIPDTCGYRSVLHPEWADHTGCYTDPASGDGLCFVKNYPNAGESPASQGPEPYDYPRTWQLQIPVIADIGEDAPPCQGTHPDAPSYEVPLDASRTYEIIGFVPFRIFDVDIGGGLPVSTDFMAGCPNEHLLTSFGFSGKTSADGTTGMCNLIRGMIKRGKNVYASTLSSDIDPVRRLAN